MNKSEASNSFFWVMFRRFFFTSIIVFAIWIYGLNNFVKSIPLSVEDIASETDAIVILTGGSRRLDEGIKLLNEGKADKLFISGVGKEVNLASLLILSGNLPDNISEMVQDIELGYMAENTKGNAEEAYLWLEKRGYKTIRLVTSNYHMQRSIVEFKRRMPEIEIIPHPVMPEQFILDNWWRHGNMKKVLVSEYNKYLITKIGLSV